MADYYWKASATMAREGAFEVSHFPHVLHAVVADPRVLETSPLNWDTFDKLMGGGDQIGILLRAVLRH